jgi:uncharacterized membrane protein (UPF0136 family)
MSEQQSLPARSAMAQRFEYLGWAIFLLGLGISAWFWDADLGDWWLIAAAAAMALYVVAGFVLRYRVSLGLIFLTVALVVLAVSRFTPYDVDLVPAILIAAGVVVLLKMFRLEQA